MTGQRITKRTLVSLKANSTEFTLWDSAVSGFGVRVRSTGAMSYVVVYRAGSGRGAPVRRYTIAAVGKITPERARSRAKAILGSVLRLFVTELTNVRRAAAHRSHQASAGALSYAGLSGRGLKKISSASSFRYSISSSRSSSDMAAHRASSMCSRKNAFQPFKSFGITISFSLSWGCSPQSGDACDGRSLFRRSTRASTSIIGGSVTSVTHPTEPLKFAALESRGHSSS
jgi:hypothetical protein